MKNILKKIDNFILDIDLFCFVTLFLSGVFVVIAINILNKYGVSKHDLSFVIMLLSLSFYFNFITSSKIFGGGKHGK